jgi:bifunctional NMN adenylyltransferase/nudix hydrolase
MDPLDGFDGPARQHNEGRMKMKPLASKYDVGVIVGRFQVPDLSPAHRDLIDTVRAQHDRVLVFLGLALTKVTENDPLDLSARRKMIEAAYPDGDVEVYYVEDIPDNNPAWSKRLDREIHRVLGPKPTVMLYGGRSSFLRDPRTDEPIYTGNYPTTELVSDGDADWGGVSGTELREKASASVGASRDFRWGVVWAANNGYMNPIPTVDVAIFNDDDTKLLLVRKKYESGWRFIGGFAECRLDTYEADARAEAQQEANVSITDPEYMLSAIIDDPRYRNGSRRIKTLLFKAKVMFGNAKADDDVFEAKWFDIDQLTVETFQPLHRPLWRSLATKLNIAH